MSGTKAAIKAMKAAYDSKDFRSAVDKATELLREDTRNYAGNLVLGAAHCELGNLVDSEKAFLTVLEIKPGDLEGLQGLIRVYERQNPKNLDRYHDAAVALANGFVKAEKLDHCQKLVERYIAFTKEHGTLSQRRRALELTTPDSSLYEALEGRVHHPSLTYLRITEMLEAEEREFVNREIGERRTRLGSRIEHVTNEVKREAFLQFDLCKAYQNLIDWTNDDEIRLACEEKLLQRNFDILVALPFKEKEAQRAEVWKLAEGMVIIKRPFQLAWNVFLEWRDFERLEDYDKLALIDFIEIFPKAGLAKVVNGFLQSETGHLSTKESQHSSEDSDAGVKDDALPKQMTPDERYFTMTEGLEDCKKSILAHRIMGDLYLNSEEWSSAVPVARKACELVKDLQTQTGLDLTSTRDAATITLATSLISFQSPKNHPEARELFEGVLEHNGTSTASLLGLGLILEEEEDYDEAIQFFQKAKNRDAESVIIRAELAWCQALGGDFQTGHDELQDVFEVLQESGNPNRELKARVLHRIGYCLWHIDTSDRARKDRTGAYARFVSAIKTDPSYAPAYTSLGIFYADYKKDGVRARRSFEKAFDLSPSEIEAAERLARVFADSGDWELVEAVSQRVIDSGKARAAPGSKKKSYSWPFAALGIVQLSKQDYAKSTISFNAALRISPKDCHAIIGLGESYHNSGRHIAATKAFRLAQQYESESDTETESQAWFTKYMLANVNRDLGLFSDAIQLYDEVLQTKPDEFGVQMALLRTLTESGFREIERGMLGSAAESASRAIDLAAEIATKYSDTANLWILVGDACSIFSWSKHYSSMLNLSTLQKLLAVGETAEAFELLSTVDRISISNITVQDEMAKTATADGEADIPALAAILAHKRAVIASAGDMYCQAVAWYNLGWAEHRAHITVKLSDVRTENGQVRRQKRFLKAAYACFKQAIELESGNSDFWNALGVSTSHLNAKVAQHSFVRALHINEKNAVTWTNLGTLYLIENEFNLAKAAFTRAQSIDPDYAYCWFGQGIAAANLGYSDEAKYQFKHAFEISTTAAVPPRRQYPAAYFDQLFLPQATMDSAKFIKVLFTLDQLRKQAPSDVRISHLQANFLERTGDDDRAESILLEVHDSLEAQYEKSEELVVLGQFIQAKSDLARVQLANGKYENAIENADTAFALIDSDEPGMMTDTARFKVKLSSSLSAGLAHYSMGEFEKALESFGTAQEISGRSVDVLCLLAKVLWATGREREREIAREYLMESVEKDTTSVEAVTLLGAVALMDGDQDAIEAVEADLKDMRRRDDLTAHERKSLSTLFLLMSKHGLTGDQNLSLEERQLEDARALIMINPSIPEGWAQLAATSKESFPAEMALARTLRNIPPGGSLGADDLAEAYALSEKRGDALRAIMTAPWNRSGWNSLLTALES